MTASAHPGRTLFVNLPVVDLERSFFDLDGDGWQVMWMDPVAAERGPEAFAASFQDADASA